MNQLQIEVLSELFEYRRKVKLAIAMKKHPLRQMVWSLFSDVELVKLLWSAESYLNAELEYLDYEISLGLQSGEIVIEETYKVLGYERPRTV